MKQYYDLLFTNKITPNGLFILHCVYNNYHYPNYVNFIHEQYRLELTGFLDSNKQITSKGLIILKQTEDALKHLKPVKLKKVVLKDWENNIIAFNNMFPKGKRPNTTISYKTNPKELFERFVWFFKEYPDYTWEQVLNATQKYSNTFHESNDYTYMNSSKYFIKREDKNRTTSSPLASFIYNIEQGDEDVNDGTYYFGS